jgi:hypothetical protein
LLPHSRRDENFGYQISVTLSVRAIRAPEFASACSCTIETMPSGAPMTLNTLPDSAEEPLGFQEVDRREQLITILATSLGVMIVAAIAVLMGMA